MPIEIKELHIKAVIAPPREAPSRSGSLPAPDLEKLKKELLRECVEEVFRKLEEKQER
jgi:hypothetical protein